MLHSLTDVIIILFTQELSDRPGTMTNAITRRDFLNGFALSVAASTHPILSVSPAVAGGSSIDYPPGLTGLRGSNEAAFSVLHGIAREGKSYALDSVAPSESYDLIVVGAGIAGLTAAWAYAQRQPKARILILDNHDDFGGHARRCELDVDGRQLLGYGGSESMVAPRSHYNGEIGKVLKKLGINTEQFYSERVFHRSLYPRLGLSRGVFFDAETFGRDALVTGDPLLLGFDEFAPKNPNARPIAEFLKACPLSASTRAGLTELFEGKRDYLKSLSKKEKLTRLAAISYRTFLLDVCKLPAEAANYFQGRSHDNFGLGIDAIAAREAMSGGFPGAAALRLADALKDDGGHDDEPYIHHFPDGNATIARALVRALIPDVAPPGDIAQLVSARFNYAKLDEASSVVRLRLNASVVAVRNQSATHGTGVSVGYVRNGTLEHATSRHVVVAAFAAVVPHICPEIDPNARAIWTSNVRSPLLYTKVAIKNWHSFVNLGVHKISAPMAFSSTVKLDYPVSIGSYRFPREPSQPMGLQLVHVPVVQNQGHDARSQARLGRQWLFETPFQTIEANIRSDLQRMLGKGGFNADRDIAAITVNRWAHGYSYAPNSLFDDVAAVENWKSVMQAPLGNIAFANSDTAWDAYAHAAMGEAIRAVGQLLPE